VPILAAAMARMPNRTMALAVLVSIAALLPFNVGGGNGYGIALYASYNRLGTALTLAVLALLSGGWIGAKATNARVLIVSIPATFAQAGGRKQIVTPPGSREWRPNQPRPSNSLVTALAKAHHWRNLIETGHYASAAELARKERQNESYVCRILRLTLLAPDIVEATPVPSNSGKRRRGCLSPSWGKSCCIRPFL
jgi:hypothetical protein